MSDNTNQTFTIRDRFHLPCADPQFHWKRVIRAAWADDGNIIPDGQEWHITAIYCGK
jgi:hypothetical protein